MVAYFDNMVGDGSVGGRGCGDALVAGGGDAGRRTRYTALMFRNYPLAAYNMVAARLTDLRAADSTQVPFKK